MFTGIVQAKVKIERIEIKQNLSVIYLILPEAYSSDVKIGASIAIDGVCLTVTSFSPQSREVSFDVMQQTLNLTTLATLNEGDWVNIERSAKLNAEVGGHHVSGHCDAVAEITQILQTENNQLTTYSVPQSHLRYLFDKGFISLNGCSLTIASIDKLHCLITVSFIPETLRSTSHGLKEEGDRVNLEVDRQTQTIVDTVERVLLECERGG